jgi:hypothetical protein
MSYFSYFQKGNYDLDGESLRKLTNISQYTTIFSRIADDISFYTYYTMANGERLDNISQKLYGSPDYYWTIFLINPDITNVFRDIRKEPLEVLSYAQNKYTGVALTLPTNQTWPLPNITLGGEITFNGATGVVLSVNPTVGNIQVNVTEGTFPTTAFTASGINFTGSVTMPNATHHVLDADTGDQVAYNSSVVKTYVSNLEYENSLNDEKGQLKVIRPTYIYEVVKRFEREMARK